MPSSIASERTSRRHDWRVVRWRAGQRPRFIVDAEGTRWSVWFQGPAYPAFDLVRIYPIGNGPPRLAGIARGSWDTLEDRALEEALRESFRSSG